MAIRRDGLPLAQRGRLPHPPRRRCAPRNNGGRRNKEQGNKKQRVNVEIGCWRLDFLVLFFLVLFYFVLVLLTLLQQFLPHLEVCIITVCFGEFDYLLSSFSCAFFVTHFELDISFQHEYPVCRWIHFCGFGGPL